MDALLERVLEKELAGRLKELEKLKENKDESNKPISPNDGITYVLWLFTDENFRRPEKLASAFSQLSDDWLLTVLKKIFYELYEDVKDSLSLSWDSIGYDKDPYQSNLDLRGFKKKGYQGFYLRPAKMFELARMFGLSRLPYLAVSGMRFISATLLKK